MLDETARTFAALQPIAIQVRHLHASADAVAGELKIALDATTELFVVAVIAINADGQISRSGPTSAGAMPRDSGRTEQGATDEDRREQL